MQTPKFKVGDTVWTSAITTGPPDTCKTCNQHVHVDRGSKENWQLCVESYTVKGYEIRHNLRYKESGISYRLSDESWLRPEDRICATEAEATKEAEIQRDEEVARALQWEAEDVLSIT